MWWLPIELALPGSRTMRVKLAPPVGTGSVNQLQFYRWFSQQLLNLLVNHQLSSCLMNLMAITWGMLHFQTHPYEEHESWFAISPLCARWSWFEITFPQVIWPKNDATMWQQNTQEMTALLQEMERDSTKKSWFGSRSQPFTSAT